MLELTPDELLTTTRTVRKRLDLSRPVPRAVVEECLAVALQAPNGSNANSWRWIAVEDDHVVYQFTMKCKTKRGRDYENDYLSPGEARERKDPPLPGVLGRSHPTERGCHAVRISRSQMARSSPQ